MDNDISLKLHSLADSLQPLKNHFNHNKGNPRFLALLSPMWPRWGQQGARAVHESIINKFPKTEISVSIVWIRMLPGDSEATAKEKAVLFNDARVHQFWDPDQLSGKAIAESLGYHGKVAWDIYLIYQSSDEWIEAPPAPACWMHQISESWASRSHFHTGDDLLKELYTAAKKITTY